MKILIAEDDPTSCRLLEASLQKWGYEVVICRDGDEAWQTLQRDDAPRLAILDWMMPGMDGTEVCRRVRQLQREAYIYLILLTAKSDKEDLIAGLEAGADDYLTKPFHRQELKVRLRAGRRLLELQQALIAARDRMRDKASHDHLTGLWNREVIFRFLESELDRCRREGSALTVILADIDHFKQVNDNYGHLAGDSVLRVIASRFRLSCRSHDSIARYGGEEFLFVIPNCDSNEASILADRIREAIGGTPMDTPDGMISVTLSLGVAKSTDFPVADSEQLVRAADSALYRAKRNGRNRFEVAGPADLTRQVNEGA